MQNKIPAIRTCLHPFIELWKDKKISDKEFSAVYIAIFCIFRSPVNFLGGLRNELSTPNSSKTLTTSDFANLLGPLLPPLWLKKKSLQRLCGETSFLSFFTAHQWRSIPESVNITLACWEKGTYPLLLTTELPSPEDVLTLQCQGQRCVSIIIDDRISSLIDGKRDALGFIIHDLIHAHHFFADPARAEAQVQFCRHLQQLLKDPLLQQWLTRDTDFVREFEYLMSDMNSAPLHLLKTFKAILLGSFKRQQNLHLSATLSAPQELAFKELFLHFLTPWNLTQPLLEAALRLNTPLEQRPYDAEVLTAALYKIPRAEIGKLWYTQSP